MGEIVGNSMGKRIQYLRKKRGWTQAQLGNVIRVSRDVVAKWEGDKIDISSSYVSFLALILNVSCDFIITGKECKNIYTIDTLGISQSAITSLENRVNTIHDVNPDENMEWINYIIADLIDDEMIFGYWRSAKNAQYHFDQGVPPKAMSDKPKSIELLPNGVFLIDGKQVDDVDAALETEDTREGRIVTKYLERTGFSMMDAYDAARYYVHKVVEIIEKSLLEGISNGKA